MSISTTARKIVSRQYRMSVVVDFGAEATDFTYGATVKLPPNTLLLSGAVNVTTAFNGTTPALTVTDNAAAPVSLFGSVSASATGVTGALAANAGHLYSTGAVLTVAVSGGATSGAALVILDVIQVGRENEVYAS